MERAPGADKRSRELHVCARTFEQPRVLVAEPQQAELIEAPVADAPVFEAQLFMGRVLLSGGHRALPFQEGLLSYLLQRARGKVVVGGP